MKKKNIVLLGGGHGLSAITKGFINDEYETTIIVSTTDSGGHTGLLRSEFDIPALGDIRRCIASLTDSEPIKYFLEYRFDELHEIKNLSLGNLMLLSLLTQNDLEKSLLILKKQMNLKATILPSLNYSCDVYAKYEDNTITVGESNIPSKKKIKDIFYSSKTYITQKVKDALKNADYVVISPGSLYTSIMPILAIEDIKKILRRSNAKLIYISNIMTQNGETDNCSILDTIKVIEKKLSRKLDIIISSSSIIDQKRREKYSYELSFPIKPSEDKRIIYAPLLDENSDYIRHDYKLLEQVFKTIKKDR